MYLSYMTITYVVANLAIDDDRSPELHLFIKSNEEDLGKSDPSVWERTRKAGDIRASYQLLPFLLFLSEKTFLLAIAVGEKQLG